MYCNVGCFFLIALRICVYTSIGIVTNFSVHIYVLIFVVKKWQGLIEFLWSYPMLCRKSVQKAISVSSDGENGEIFSCPF